MFVVAHFHIVMGVASFFGMFAGVYHWFPKMFGRYLNSTLGYIHFWVTMIGSYLIFWPMHYQGLAGIPRRYLDKRGWVSFNDFPELDKMITIVSIIVFAVQLMFVFNFIYSIFKGRKVTNQNPWGANTLEWTTPFVRDMVTGKEKFLKYTVGHMIMQKTEENLFRRQNRLVKMRVSTRSER